MTVAQTQVKSKRKLLLYPGEDGYFIVEVPSLLHSVLSPE